MILTVTSRWALVERRAPGIPPRFYKRGYGMGSGSKGNARIFLEKCLLKQPE